MMRWHVMETRRAATCYFLAGGKPPSLFNGLAGVIQIRLMWPRSAWSRPAQTNILPYHCVIAYWDTFIIMVNLRWLLSTYCIHQHCGTIPSKLREAKNLLIQRYTYFVLSGGLGWHRPGYLHCLAECRSGGPTGQGGKLGSRSDDVSRKGLQPPSWSGRCPGDKGSAPPR